MQMNILHIHTHDSGRYFRHFGHADAPTEALSRWAVNRAITFRNAFTPAPTCSPSRASLLTGTYPHENGMVGLAHRGFSLNDYSRHLVSFLKGKGYRTALCGVQHEAAGCFDHGRGAEIIGYDVDLTADLEAATPDGDETAVWDRENSRRAAEWLRGGALQGPVGGAASAGIAGDGPSGRAAAGERPSAGETPAGPFFLSLGLFSTHREFPSRPAVDPEGVRPLPKIANTRETRIDHARFLESLSVVDDCFRTVMAALEESPFAGSTIVLVTSDHGIAQPFSKCNLNADGQGVALMVRVPGAEPPVPFCDALVSTIDLFPTLCEVLGLAPPEYLRGRSFAHLFSNPDAEHRHHLFGEVNFHTSYEPMRSVRTRFYNLVVNYDHDHLHIHPSNMDDSPAKSILLSKGFAYAGKAPVELYDLETDPLEQINRADDPACREKMRELELLLREWQEETDDPLLNGEISPPEGSVVNRSECVDPDSKDPDDYL